MAHSHHLHREHQVSHRRVGHILKDEPAGSKEHTKSHAFSKVTSKTAAEMHDAKVAGGKGPKRFARGGKVKHGKSGHQTNIAIVVPHRPATPPAAGPLAGAGPMPAPAPSPMGAGPGGPPGMPPGAPPPGMPPGMPMHKRGGKVFAKGGKVIDGEADKADIKKWSKRAESESYFRGGAATGVGREEKAARAKRK